jgi:hypothetical protein
MRFFRRAIGGLRALFRKTRGEQELDAELREFLEISVEQKIRTGATRPDPLRAARLELDLPARRAARINPVEALRRS